MWCRIEAPHFVASLELVDFSRDLPSFYVVVHTAPILKYMKKWYLDDVKRYCKEKNWKLQIYK